MSILSFSSMTNAQRARSVLSSAGIYSRVISIDPNLTKKGCSWGISLDSAAKQRALSVLRSKNIYFGEVVGG